MKLIQIEFFQFLLLLFLASTTHIHTYTHTYTQNQCQILYSKLLKLTQSHQNRLLSHQHYPEHLLKVNEIELILLQIMYS